MNTFLHQWKWDFRRIRTLWVVWLVVLAALAAAPMVAPGTEAGMRVAMPLLSVAQVVVVFLFGVLLVARLMYATPFAGSHSFWKTRPLTPRGMFWTKTVMIVVLVWLPVVVTQLAGWAAAGAGARYVAWGGVQFGALTLAMALLAAFWAARCERFGMFLVCFVSTWAWAAVVAIVARQWAGRSGFIPFLTDAARATEHPAAVATSTIIASMLILAAGAALAWWIGGTGRSPRATVVSFAVLLVGVTVANTAHNLWRVGFLGNRADLPREELPVTVLHQHEEPGPGQQLLWSQLAVEVPEGQFAWVKSSRAFYDADPPTHHQASFTPDHNSAVAAREQAAALAVHYPDGTEIRIEEERMRSALHYGDLKGKGRLEGELEFYLATWRKVASLPLHAGAKARRADGGIVFIVALNDGPAELRVRVSVVRPPWGFREWNPLQRHQRHEETFFVLYLSDGSHAVVGDSGRQWSAGGALFSMDSHTETMTFSHRRLFGAGRSGDLDGARLDIFTAVPVATAAGSFREEGWKPYGYRPYKEQSAEVKPPVVAVRQLPVDPSPQEVDAYLDGILFNVPSNHGGEAWRKTKERLKAIGPKHLDRLVRRLPVGQYMDDLVIHVIRELATGDHRAVLAEALEREPNLAAIFLEKNWQDTAAPILAKRLQKRVPLEWRATWPSVAVVASQADPATYDDLRWHFVHSPTGHRRMAEALAACPGFPLDDAIAELWERVRFEYESRRHPVAVLAAGIGNKEALRQAFVHYAGDPRDENLQLLSEIAKHPGGDLLPGWIHENFETLEFDPAARKWFQP